MDKSAAPRTGALETKDGLRAKVWWSILTTVVCTIAVVVAGVIYVGMTAQRITRESEQKWCGVVITLDDTYSRIPPASPLGQRVADEMKRLRRDFGC